MRNLRERLRVVLFAILALAALRRSSIAAEAQPVAYKLTATFKVGGDGGWDYATINKGELYVTRTTHTIAINVATEAVVADIAGQSASHGVAIVPDAHRGFISDGGSGSVMI